MLFRSDGSVTITGDVYTYGGDLSITNAPRPKVREQDGIIIGPSGGVTLSTSSLGSTTSGASFGDITISSTAEAVDVAVSIWLPKSNSEIRIGSGSQGAAVTQLIGANVSLSSAAKNAPWWRPTSNQINTLFEGNAWKMAGDISGLTVEEVAADPLTTALQGIEDYFIPFDIAISSSEDAVAITNALLQASGAGNSLQISSESINKLAATA